MPDQTRDSNALGLSGFLKVLRRRWWIIALCVIVIPGIAVALAVNETKMYRASASLLFRDSEVDQNFFGTSSGSAYVDPTREAVTNIELISLGEVAARAARSIGPNVDPGRVAAAVSVIQNPESDLAVIQAVDTDPKMAASIANAIASSYIQFRKDADQARFRETEALISRQLRDLPANRRSGQEARVLRSRRNELQILASLQTGNAVQVQRAQAPRDPFAPRPFRRGVLALLFAALLGFALALLRERMDRRLREVGDVREIWGEVPVLAAVPRSSGLSTDDGRRYTADPSKSEVEAFRTLRANLRYFNLNGTGIRSVLVTSAGPRDGKSTVAWNLAAIEAAPGRRVLVIETDLRAPSLRTFLPHDSTNGHPPPGLSEYLSGNADWADVKNAVTMQMSDGSVADTTLDVVFAGWIPPNPSDLLESERMQWLIETAQEEYDLVVVDSPPLGLVADAIPIIKAVDGVIVVTGLEQTTAHNSQKLREQLDNLGARVLGLVLNYVPPRQGGYGYGYGYGYGADANATDRNRVRKLLKT